ncbi:MAG: hypothetical protein K9K86_11710 [Pseudomonadales bacterium]|nr:hypothetical protein [Pseudomonadales bacterium]
MKKRLWILVSVIAVAYTALRWDYHVSNYLFEKICNDPEKVGLFVYEKVELGSEYLKTVSESEVSISVDPRLLVESNKILDVERFSKNFVYKQYEYLPISSVGPIGFLQSYVIRKIDGKTLGKAVSASNGKGWLAQWLGVNFGGGGINCPLGADRQTKYSYYRRDHELLIRNIFLTKFKGVE